MNFVLSTTMRFIVAPLAVLVGTTLAHAEPYLAVQEGFKCVQCHVNPSGGGLRNVFGNAYAQAQLAATRIDTGDTVWTGMVGQMLSLGGNFRAAASVGNIPHQQQTRAFEAEDFGVAQVVDALEVRTVAAVPNARCAIDRSHVPAHGVGRVRRPFVDPRRVQPRQLGHTAGEAIPAPWLTMASTRSPNTTSRSLVHPKHRLCPRRRGRDQGTLVPTLLR